MSFKGILKAVAPVLGTLIGGPLGGIAARALGSALLGDESASESDIESAVLNASPSDLAKIKQAEADTKVALAEIGLDEKKIEMMDRDSARRRQVLTEDSTPTILGYALTLGFFGVLGILIFYPVQPSAQQIMDVMLGSLGTAWISVITYFFGSSAGSAAKNKLLGAAK